MPFRFLSQGMHQHRSPGRHIQAHLGGKDHDEISTLLLGTSLLLGTTANAANIVATLSFTGAALNNGGTASGTFTYVYDSVTKRLVGGNPLEFDGVSDLPNSGYSGRVSVTAGTNGPTGGFTWTLNKPGFTSNVTRVEAFTDHDPYRLQFIKDGPTGRFGAIIYFTGLGTETQLATYGSFYAPDNYNANFQTAGTSVGTLGSGAVPEPSSWMMLIAGFGIVGAVRRRQRLAGVAA